MKLKGIELNGTYKVEFNNTWFEVYDKRNNQIYYEDRSGYWAKNEYDERDNQIYYVNSDGVWYKSDYDEKGNEIYYEDSGGEFFDNRVKELTINEIETLLGYRIKIKGEKK